MCSIYSPLGFTVVDVVVVLVVVGFTVVVLVVEVVVGFTVVVDVVVGFTVVLVVVGFTVVEVVDVVVVVGFTVVVLVVEVFLVVVVELTLKMQPLRQRTYLGCKLPRPCKHQEQSSVLLLGLDVNQQ